MTTVAKPAISYLTVGRVAQYRTNMVDSSHREVSFVHDGLYESRARVYLGGSQESVPDSHTVLVEARTGCDNRPSGRVEVHAVDVATAEYAVEVLSQLAEAIAASEGGVEKSPAAGTLEVFVECLQRRVDGQAWAVVDNGTRVISQFLTQEQAQEAIHSGEEDPQDLLDDDEGDWPDLSIELRPADPNIPIAGAHWTTAEAT